MGPVLAELQTATTPNGVASQGKLYLYKQGDHGESFLKLCLPEPGKAGSFNLSVR